MGGGASPSPPGVSGVYPGGGHTDEGLYPGGGFNPDLGFDGETVILKPPGSVEVGVDSSAYNHHYYNHY